MNTENAAAALNAEYSAKIIDAQLSMDARRDAAFVDIPFVICGEELRPMNLRHFLLLIAARNAHVAGVVRPTDLRESVTFWAAHNVQLMWIVSPEFSRDERAKKRFMRRVGKLSFDEVGRGLQEYLEETFADAPRGKRPAIGENNQADLGDASFAAFLTHRIASGYHWDYERIHSLPLKVLFQLLRVLVVEDALKNGKHPPASGNEVDGLWAEYLLRNNEL